MRKIFATTLLCTVLAASPGAAAQLEAPSGVGGCVFLGISREMRLATMAAYARGGPSAIGEVQNLRREIQEPARRCSDGGDINRDHALLAAFLSTVMKSTNALKLSRHGLPQARLDAVWAQAAQADKALFVAHAQSFFAGQPAPEFSEQGAAELVDALALSPSTRAEAHRDVIHYFQAVAMNEMAEARLASKAGQ
jgi:hypothetical protein